MKKFNFDDFIVCSCREISKDFFYENIVGKEGVVEIDSKEFFIIKNENEYFIFPCECVYDYINNLKQNAIYDPLTGAYNKRELLEYLNKYLKNFLRYKKDNFSIMMFDIDHFKKINDTYGHLAGDFILKEFVKIIKQNIRESDILGRYGGEEFILILPNTKVSGAMKLATRIKETVEEHDFEFNKTILKITVSIGITSASLNDSVESLIQRADDALYEAKQKGRNRIEYR